MLRKQRLFFVGICLFLAACAPTVLPPAPTATALPPTPTPTITPTATPIPPLVLSVPWPEQVSALEPVPVAAKLVPPLYVEAAAQISATVFDPEGQVYEVFELSVQEGQRYQSPEALYLPLDPMPGHWLLLLQVDTDLEVEGSPVLTFQPELLHTHDLSGTLAFGVSLNVPQAFTEVSASGDAWSGGRVWRYTDNEIGLWWAPGPDEPLSPDVASVFLEATHDDTSVSATEFITETAWLGRPALRFEEQWVGVNAGPAIAWVIEGDDSWLYVLRARSLGGQSLSRLLIDVVRTFAFQETP